jgi:hypothetical protein
MLYGIHQGLSKVTGEDALAIDTDEAKIVGSGVAGVLAFHKVKISPKQEAYALLMEAMAQVYGPMAAVVYMKFKMRQDEKKSKPPSATVHPFPVDLTPGKSPLPPNAFSPGTIMKGPNNDGPQ